MLPSQTVRRQALSQLQRIAERECKLPLLSSHLFLTLCLPTFSEFLFLLLLYFLPFLVEGMLLDSLLPPLFLFSLWLRRFIDFACFCYCYRRVTQKNRWQSFYHLWSEKVYIAQVGLQLEFLNYFLLFHIILPDLLTHLSRIQQLVICSVICLNLILSVFLYFSAFLTNSRFQIIQSGLYVIPRISCWFAATSMGNCIGKNRLNRSNCEVVKVGKNPVIEKSVNGKGQFTVCF